MKARKNIWFGIVIAALVGFACLTCSKSNNPYKLTISTVGASFNGTYRLGDQIPVAIDQNAIVSIGSNQYYYETIIDEIKSFLNVSVNLGTSTMDGSIDIYLFKNSQVRKSGNKPISASSTDRNLTMMYDVTLDPNAKSDLDDDEIIDLP